jgi:hypothetical protein
MTISVCYSFNDTATFYWGASLPNQEMCLCDRDIDFASFYDFDIWFKNYSYSMVFFVFHFIMWVYSRWMMGKNGVVMVFNATFNNVSVILWRSIWKQDINNKPKYHIWWLQIQENHRTYIALGKERMGKSRKFSSQISTKHFLNTITTPFLPIIQRL